MSANVRVMISGPEDSGVRLICFPYAGGTAVAFKPLASQLPPHWSVAAIEPPGHGFNRGMAMDDVQTMVTTYRASLAEHLQAPCFLLGHSLGGLVAYELARQLEAERRPVRGVFVCAVRGPLRVVDEVWSTLDDEQIFAKLDEIDGVPPAFHANRAAFRAFLSPIRAGFRALERYQHQPGPPLETPLWSIGGETDNYVFVPRAREWTAYGCGAAFMSTPGKHFFLETHAADLARKIVECVDKPQDSAV